MVLVNRNTVHDLPGLRPDEPQPGTPETDSRLHAIASAISNMNEHEKTFLSQKTLSTNGALTPRSVHTPRTHLSTPRLLHSSRSKRFGLEEHNATLLNSTVPFTNRNSAISNSYSSPRQYALSGTHMRREGSLIVRGERHQDGFALDRKGFDYDEFEEIQLEQLKHHRPKPDRLYMTCDIYVKACHVAGITPSQTYLKQLKESRDIIMANTSLSHLTVKPIAISLVRDHRMMTLDVSGNDIGPLGVSYIAEMIKENDTIYELNLSGTNPGAGGLEALAKVMGYNKSIHILRLESNYLDHTETNFLVDILKVAPCLSELYLGHNNLGYEGSKILAKEIETNTTLRILDVQWNHFRKESGKVFCEALKHNKGLHQLNVSWNGLSKEGCIALARALPKNSTLKELDLTNNRIDVVSLPFLLHGLVRNSTLENLKLGKNPMTTEGVKAVVRAITGAKDMAVRYLNVEDIPVDREFTLLLKKMQESRQIEVEHGVEMYSAVELNMREHDPHDLNRFDPVMVLIEYIRIDNLRLIDLFQFFDTDNMGLISRENLRNGVATLGLPLTEHHLDCIMKDIDKKRDGYIDLEEFMMAQRDMAKVVIQRTTRAKGRGKEDLGLKELRQILKELVEKRNQRNKEKASNRVKSAALARALSAKQAQKPGTPGSKPSTPARRERIETKRASLTVTKPKYSKGARKKKSVSTV